MNLSVRFYFSLLRNSCIILHIMKRFFSVFSVCCIAVVFSSCKTETPVQTVDNSSFGLLQQKVFGKTCIGCHTAGSTFVLGSGLILDQAVAYQNLVSVPAHNTNANADGLLRIKPGNPDSSFLYMKIHGLPAGKSYGSPMPMGYAPLSVGQQQFI